MIRSWDVMLTQSSGVGNSTSHIKKPNPFTICWGFTRKDVSDFITMLFAHQLILSICLLTTKTDTILFAICSHVGNYVSLLLGSLDELSHIDSALRWGTPYRVTPPPRQLQHRLSRLPCGGCSCCEFHSLLHCLFSFLLPQG